MNNNLEPGTAIGGNPNTGSYATPCLRDEGPPGSETLALLVPHIGPRCSYCGCVPEEPHSSRCAVTKVGVDPYWAEYPSDVQAERDALREALNRLAGADATRRLSDAWERIEELEGREAFHADPLDPGRAAHTIMVLEGRAGELEAALELFACGPRPDGTYNLSREAVEQRAKEVLCEEER